MIVEDSSEHDHSRWLCEYDASHIFSITEHITSRGKRKTSDTDESYEWPFSASDMIMLKSDSVSEVLEEESLSVPAGYSEGFVSGLVLSEIRCGLEALYYTDSLVKSVSNKGHFAQLSLTKTLSNSDFCDINVEETQSQPFKSVLSAVSDLRAKGKMIKNNIQSGSSKDNTAYINTDKYHIYIVNKTDKKASLSQPLSSENSSSRARAGSSLLLSEHVPYSPTDNDKAERQYLNPAPDGGGKDNNDVNNLSSCRDKKCDKRFTVTNIGKDVEDVSKNVVENVVITDSVIDAKEDVEQPGENIKEEEMVSMKPSFIRKPSLVRTQGSGLPRLLKATSPNPSSPRLASRTLPTPPNTGMKPVNKLPNPFFPKTTTRPNLTPLKLPENLNLSMKPDLSMKSEPRSEPKSDLSMNTKSKPSLLNRLRAVHANTKTVDIELEEEMTEDDDEILFEEEYVFVEEDDIKEEDEEDVEEMVDEDEEDLSDVFSDGEGQGQFPTTCLSAIEEVESNSPSSTSDRTINKHIPTLRTEGSDRYPQQQAPLSSSGRYPHVKKPEDKQEISADIVRTHGCEECPSCGEVSKLIHSLARDITSMGSSEKHTEFEASWKKMKVLIKSVLSTKDIINLLPCKACDICENMCGIIHKFKLSKSGKLRDTKECLRAEYANVIKAIDPGTSVLLDTCSTMSNKPTEVKQTKKLSSFANEVFNELCGILKTNQSKRARWFEEMKRPCDDVKDLSSSEFDTPTENICDDTSAGLNTIPLYEAADTYQVKKKKEKRSSNSMKSSSSLNTLSDNLKNDLIDKINVAIFKEVDSMKKDLANRILKSLSLSVSTPDLKSIKEGIRTDNEGGVTSWTEGLSTSFSSSSSSSVLEVQPLRNNKPNLFIPLEVNNNITPARKPTKYDLIKCHAKFSNKSNSSTSNKSNPQFKQAQMKQQPQLRPQLKTPSASMSSKKPINITPKIQTPSSSINDSKSSTRKRKCVKKKVPKSQRSKQQDNKVEAILTSITGIASKNNKKLSRSKKSLNGFFVESGSETESTMTSSESSLDLKLDSREASVREDKGGDDSMSMCTSTSFTDTNAGINKFNNVLDSFKVQKKVSMPSSSECTTTIQDDKDEPGKDVEDEKDDDVTKPAFKCVCCTWEDASLNSSESCPHPPQQQQNTPQLQEHIKKHEEKHQQKEQVPPPPSSSSDRTINKHVLTLKTEGSEYPKQQVPSSSSSSSSDTGGVTDDFTAHTVFHSAKTQQKGVSHAGKMKTGPAKIKLDLPRSLTKNSASCFVINKPVTVRRPPQTPVEGKVSQSRPDAKSMPKVSRQILKKQQHSESAVRSVGKVNNFKQSSVQPRVAQQLPKPVMVSRPTTHHSKPLLTSKAKSHFKAPIAPKQSVQPKQIPQIRQVTPQMPSINQNMSQPKTNPHTQIPNLETARIFYKTPNARGSFKQYGSLQNLSQSTQSSLKESNPSLNKSAGSLTKNIPQPFTRLINTQSADMPLSQISTPKSSSPFRREFNITSLSKGITASPIKPSTNYHGANLIKPSSLDTSRITNVTKSKSIDVQKTSSANSYGSNVKTSGEMNNVRKYEQATKRGSQSNLSGIKFPGSRNYKLK